MSSGHCTHETRLGQSVNGGRRESAFEGMLGNMVRNLELDNGGLRRRRADFPRSQSKPLHSPSLRI